MQTGVSSQKIQKKPTQRRPPFSIITNLKPSKNHPKPTFKPDRSKQTVALIILQLVKWGAKGNKITKQLTLQNMAH